MLGTRIRGQRRMVPGSATLVVATGVALSACVDSTEEERGGQGYVLVGQGLDAAAGEYAWVSTRFHRAEANACTILASDGRCMLLQCPPAASSSQQSLPAGTVSVTAQQSAVLEPGSDGNYPTWSGTGALWTSGQSIAINVEGFQEDPPAFSTSLLGPAPITLTAPAEAAAAVARGAGMTVAWEGASDGLVQVSLNANGTGAKSVNCQYSASDLSLTIPPNILAGLPAGTVKLEIAVTSGLTQTSAAAWTFTAMARRSIRTLDLTLE